MKNINERENTIPLDSGTDHRTPREIFEEYALRVREHAARLKELDKKGVGEAYIRNAL